jgi:thymidylate synthase
MSPSYAAAEVMWYLSGTDDVSLLLPYAPQYSRFTEDGAHAFGAYGWRWATDSVFRSHISGHNYKWVEFEIDQNKWPSGKRIKPRTQLELLMLLLKEKPETRQAVLAMWNGGDLLHAYLGDKKDLPCTTSLKFIVRNGKLNCWAEMRSNDVWLGLPYDMWCFTTIQQIIADCCGLELGWYQHSAMSMHYYKHNEEKLLPAASPAAFNTEQLLTRNNGAKLNDYLEDMIIMEKSNRENCVAGPEGFGIQDDTLPGLLVLMAATKWARNTSDLYKRLPSKLLAKYVEETCHANS